MTGRVAVVSLVVAVAAVTVPSLAAGAAPAYRIVGQPVVLRGEVPTPSGPELGNALILRVNRTLPEGSNRATKAVALFGSDVSFTPPSYASKDWGLDHVARHGVACYTESLGFETHLAGETGGRVTFHVAYRGQVAPFAGNAKVLRTTKVGDVLYPGASAVAKQLGC
jgi:hypothetical protein